MELDDLRLVRALQLAPRAGFARLAEVLGMHERTVARRYRRLHRAGVLRIFGVVNPLAVGHQLWQVRVRCRPDAAESLAAGLAARDDVAWVAVTAAGAEVLFAIRSHSAERSELLLTRGLPRSARVLDIGAGLVLHVFLGLGSQGWSELAGLLTPAEVEQLDVARGEPEELAPEPYDPAIVRVLAADGRATTARIAEAAGISEGRAARRLAALLRSRTVVIDLDLAHGAFGLTVGAQLCLTVAPARLREVGEALAALPEVGYVAALSGRENLVAAVACRDLRRLYEFTVDRVGALDGVVALEVLPYARVVKQSGGLLVDGRLVDG
ncbi:Lrp/AsnC family transcriptional regulator [Kitasatospora viridis]|uniref:AsnC family transcriptional regulator n=1 Tax=Kitasatospora viridis TaxID=281105 RepID=A0A561UBR8_9ACTN|nr:Lrp/AsnC family transcriptional regulator [Kitasatospora viridis]TWF96812.1 AsnC family transcriptional regulator [Kitasatospora viridis]